ncbi:MAG: YciI family protein [Alphaproteobacteria bacterium]|nr:YciI family protein [Alphaproteobacteria bacterium]
MLFSILIFDEPDSAALRDEYRQRHLDYLKEFDDQTLFAGPFTTDDESADLGSLRLIEFADRAAAEQHVADEPYVTGGVQKRWLIHRWKPSVPYTWRDCPRTKGNIQALFHGIDGPDGAEIRAASRAAHEAYLDDHGNSILCRGPLLTDDGAAPAGGVILMDIPDMAAARALMDNEPFFRAGCYRYVTFHRWRFGRVFDRYKV